jgi:hypothetical protein
MAAISAEDMVWFGAVYQWRKRSAEKLWHHRYQPAGVA